MEWHRLRDSSMRARNPVSLLFSAPSSVSFPQLRVSGAVQSHDARTGFFFFFKQHPMAVQPKCCRGKKSRKHVNQKGLHHY